MMKRIAMIVPLVLLYFTGLNSQDVPSSPAEMEVVAMSGLKLRAHPGVHAQVLDIIPYRSKVQVVENEMNLPLEGRVGYVPGHWRYITFEGMEGYVFDGYLSSLPLPKHEFEHTQFDLDLIYPLESWVEVHFSEDASMDTIQSPLYTKIINRYSNGAKKVRMVTDQYVKVTVNFPDVRLMDVYHLLADMLSTRSEWNTFTEKTTYIKNREGLIDRIKIDIEKPVFIRKMPNGMIQAEIKSFAPECSITGVDME